MTVLTDPVELDPVGLADLEYRATASATSYSVVQLAAYRRHPPSTMFQMCLCEDDRSAEPDLA